MLALAREALVPAVQPTGPAKAPVPAAGRLKEIAAERAHRPELWAGREPACLSQRGSDRRVALEVGERHARADPVAVDSPRDDAADVDERLGLQQARAQQRHHLGAAVNRRAAVELEARRPPELQPSPSPGPRPRAARAASLRARSAAPARLRRWRRGLRW